MRDMERIWVHPDFKRKLKERAVMEGTSILDFTKRVSSSELDKVLEEFRPKKRTGFEKFI